MNRALLAKGRFMMLLLFFLCPNVLTFQGCQNSTAIESSVLFDFEKDADLDRIEFKCKTRFYLAGEYKKSGERSLKMEFYPTDLVGFIGKDFSHDWRNAGAVNVWIYNPSNLPQTIYMEINGKRETLIKHVEKLQPGANDLSITLNKIDADELKKINNFAFYLKHINHKTTLYFDRIEVV